MFFRKLTLPTVIAVVWTKCERRLAELPRKTNEEEFESKMIGSDMKIERRPFFSIERFRPGM
jgi:hypothetical protein